ncbi:MAG: thiol reductant ABC exporter subunit CydD, partial [Spirochaetota bacterium]
MFSRDLWLQARKYIGPLATAIFLGAVIGTLIVAQAWLISTVISGVFLDGQTLEENQNSLVILAGVVVARSIVTYLREVSAGSVSIQVRADLKRELFSHLLKISPIRITRERTGELVNTLVQGVDRLDAYFRTYLPQLGLALLVPMIILVVVFPLDWLTGVIFLFTAPLIPLFMVLIGKEAEQRTERQWKLLGRLSSHFLDVLQGLRTLKAFGLSKRQGKVVESVSEQYATITLKVLRIAFLSALALELLATISTAIVAVQIGLRLLYGQITFVESLFVLILAPEFYFPLRQLGAAFHSGMEGIAAGERVFDLMRTDSEIPDTAPGMPQPGLATGSISFENVAYSYQEGSRISLRGVSFEVPLGKHTALIGSSGSGKSTIFSLLMGFIQPQEGQILINGLDLSNLSLSAWRSQIGWVPQFPYLFNDTVMVNILASRPDASETEVFEAARLANV